MADQKTLLDRVKDACSDPKEGIVTDDDVRYANDGLAVRVISKQIIVTAKGLKTLSDLVGDDGIIVFARTGASCKMLIKDV